MKLFLDSADAGEIRECVGRGLAQGVTVDGSLLAVAASASGREPHALLSEICEVVPGPVVVDVLARDLEGMLREGRGLAAVGPKVVIKLPPSTDGLKIVRIFSDERIATNVSSCLEPMQALLAAKAGAGYVSPPPSRPDNVAFDAIDLVARSSRSFEPTTARPRCWCLPCAIRATSSMPPWRARRWPPFRISCCSRWRSNRVSSRSGRPLRARHSMRIRQHVNPLKSDLLEIAEVPRVEPEPGRALDVELGAAEAHFLLDLAKEDPGTSFVGVEIRRELVEAVNAECDRLRIHNVRSVFANMSVDMPRLFSPASVRRFFLNFPDPWFKARQHKRRVIGPALMSEIGRALVPGGELYVMTDIFALALEAMAALEESTIFANAQGAWTFARRSPYLAKSRRERQCETEGGSHLAPPLPPNAGLTGPGGF